MVPMPPLGEILSRTHTVSMSVIPLTLTISLCLVFTFVVFFLREHNRQRFSSAESDALLPLADEVPRLASAPKSRGERQHHRDAPAGKPGGCQTGERPPCAGCQRSVDAASPSSA